MEKSVFDYSDYKTYLRELGETRARGFRKNLAQAIGCQTAYVSQILNGGSHLSLEQAEAATRFLRLSRDESRCFMLLVEIQRAGSAELSRFFSEQLTELRENHLLIKQRIQVTNVLTERHQAIYYSSWHYSAVHIAVTIPRLRTRAALGRALRISSRKLSTVLEFLLSVQLVRRSGEHFLPGPAELHLTKDSPWIEQHHANWRQQAMQRMHADSAERALHYSSISSLSASDAQKIRALLTQTIADSVAVIKQSPEEELYGFNVDFFRTDD